MNVAQATSEERASADLALARRERANALKRAVYVPKGAITERCPWCHPVRWVAVDRIDVHCRLAHPFGGHRTAAHR